MTRLQTAYQELSAARDALEQAQIAGVHQRLNIAERRAEALEKQLGNLREARERLLGRVEALKEANQGLRDYVVQLQAEREKPAPESEPLSAPDPAPTDSAPLSSENPEVTPSFALRIKSWLRGRPDQG